VPLPAHPTSSRFHSRPLTRCCSEGIVAPSSLAIAYVDNATTLDAICGKARCSIPGTTQGPACAGSRLLTPLLPLRPSSPRVLPLCSIFAILDDECSIPKGCDENIVPGIGQLAARLAAGPLWNKDKPQISINKIGSDKFSVSHYAGDVRE
jgi:hypothetical protein